MSAPSLTPHEDAARAAQASRPAPTEDFERACCAVIDVAMIEIARIMDAGHGQQRAMGFAVSIAATLIDSVASSAASRRRNEKEKRAQLIGMMLNSVLECVAGAPTYETSAPVKHAPTGAA